LDCIVTAHDPAREQPAPDQPANAEPLAAVARSLTDVPWSKIAAHVLGHEIADELLVTVPWPLPASDTFRPWSAVNVAVTA
jgi:hypothetical protein